MLKNYLPLPNKKYTLLKMWLSLLNFVVQKFKNFKTYNQTHQQKKQKRQLMGLQHSKNQYSFSDHYYVIQDSFPADSYYHLQSKLTDELFIGRQINCTDKQQAYQTQCIINQKLRNPSPFVTKLLSAQKNAQNGYCETNQKFHLLFREVSKLLSQQIQQRKIRGIPFTAQEIIMVIVRIAKGLKYIYWIGHYHGNISGKAITWPTQNFESIQLIDQWSLRNTNKLYNNTQVNQNNNKHADDLHSLGLVAKSMMQISPPLNKQQNIQIIQSLKHKIFILLSQNPLDRLQIYNVFNHRDRQLENEHIITTNNLQKINNNQGKVNLYNNGKPNYPTNPNNHHDVYRNTNMNAANINQNNHKILVSSVSGPIQVNKNNQINYQNVNNTNQNIHHNQISTVVKNNINNTKYVQPPYPTISNTPKPAFNINFNNNKTTTSTNPIYYPNSNSNIKIAQPSNISNNYSLNGLVRNTTSEFYQQKYTSAVPLPKIPTSSINNSSINDTQPPNQNNITNTSNVLTSFVNTYNNTPNFGNNAISSLNNANPIFSFNDSIRSIHGEQQNLFTSPDFFAKIHNSYENNFNNIKIEDHHSEHNNVKNQQIQPISLQHKHAANNLHQQNSGYVNSSIINNFVPVQVNHQIKHNKQLSPSLAVTTSQQIHNSTTTNLNQKQPENQTTNTQNNTNYDNSITSRQLQNQNVTVIPQLNEQSDNEEQQRQYVVQEYENGSRYEGQKLDGMRDGNGKFYYKEGSYYQGRWKKNNMHGFGRLYYPNHKLAYEGDWFIDQFHGNGKVYNDEPSSISGCFDYTNFDKIEQKWKYYEGTLVCDSKQGFGKLVLANNQYYEGNFLNDRVHGQGRFVNLYGEVVHGIWDDSKLVKILAN